MVETPTRYFLRSMALSVAGAALISVLIKEMGGSGEDDGLLLFMAFVMGLFFTVLLCPLAYIVTKGLFRAQRPARKETSLVLLAGGAICLIVVGALVLLGNGDLSMAESLRLTGIFVAGWLVYAGGMQWTRP
ncbi:MAG: hypothetical protein KDK89_16320 [Alphaproteobacteria bacterium]|nr:hypothetical protein [Alphaproteobacteria bacterium]